MTLIESPATATPAAQTRRAHRIVLIDGQRIFRQALRVLFATEEEFAVVGEAGHAAEAVELIGSLQPDVVVTELHLTDGSAVPLIEQIHARFPRTAILVLTAVRAHDVAAAVRKAGALGYLLKDGGRSGPLVPLDCPASAGDERAHGPGKPERPRGLSHRTPATSAAIGGARLSHARDRADVGRERKGGAQAARAAAHCAAAEQHRGIDTL